MSEKKEAAPEFGETNGAATSKDKSCFNDSTATAISQHLVVPRDLSRPRARAELAYRICLEVRRRHGAANFEDAEFHLFEDQIDELCASLGLEGRFKDAGDYEEFQYEICAMWPDSASGNRFKLVSAIEAFQAEPEAFVDPRLRKSAIKRTATLCYCLANAHADNEGVFYLSSRKLGDTIGVSKDTANRMLVSLVKTYGILEVVKRHPRGKRMAISYRFCEPPKSETYSEPPKSETYSEPPKSETYNLLSTSYFPLPTPSGRGGHVAEEEKEHSSPEASADEPQSLYRELCWLVRQDILSKAEAKAEALEKAMNWMRVVDRARCLKVLEQVATETSTLAVLYAANELAKDSVSESERRKYLRFRAKKHHGKIQAKKPRPKGKPRHIADILAQIKEAPNT